MFLDYLRKKESILTEELRSKKSELSKVSVHIKENHRFIEMLEKSKVTPFTEFTPQVVSASEKKKQEGLTLEEMELTRKYETLQLEIHQIEEELVELSKCNEGIVEAITEQKKIQEEEREQIAEKLSNICDTILRDPRRAEIQIKNLISSLKEKV